MKLHNKVYIPIYHPILEVDSNSIHKQILLAIELRQTLGDIDKTLNIQLFNYIMLGINTLMYRNEYFK